MAEAVFGLVGAIVGGLLTLAGSFLLEWRKEKASLRRAKRVLAHELEWTAQALDALSGKGFALKMSSEELERMLPLRGWEEEESTLAQASEKRILREEWEVVSQAYLMVTSVRNFVLLEESPGDFAATNLSSIEVAIEIARGASSLLKADLSTRGRARKEEIGRLLGPVADRLDQIKKTKPA
jgi:hypothetical protein